MSTFLALTASVECWQNDAADLLLLGPWCVPPGSAPDALPGRARMLPSPWRDRSHVRAAAADADVVSGRLLTHLSSRLNAACGVSESLRYWRVLVGPWLTHFVHAVYDRHAHLSAAFAAAPDAETAVLAESCYRTPSTTREAFIGLTDDDHYNWQLCSELIALMGRTADLRRCHVPPPADGWAPADAAPSTAADLVAAAETALLRLAGRGAVWLTCMTARRASLLRLAVRSAFRILPAPMTDQLQTVAAAAVFDDRRLGLADYGEGTHIERLCAQLLPRHLPTIYLEGYADARRLVRRTFPDAPNVLVSETGWYTNETNKFLAAEAMREGSRLVAVQHGGGYGLAAQPMALEAFESAIADAYLVWGWAGGRRPHRNVPHPIVSDLPRRSPRSSARMLFAPQGAARYLHRLGSDAAGSLWPRVADYQGRFVGTLPVDVRGRLVLRAPQRDDQAIGPTLRGRYPALRRDEIATFKASAAASSLVIVDSLGTCILESLVMNIPTVVLVHPDVWECRPEVHAWIEDLRRVGILFETPEDAAAHVAAVAADPASWWNGQELQRARQAFVEQFALSRADWADRWVEVLRDEMALSDGVPREAGSR